MNYISKPKKKIKHFEFFINILLKFEVIWTRSG